MPTTFQLVETTFPNGEGKDTQEQINGVYDYLFVLLEQLRYTLFNLDGSNINQNALSEFIKNISDPIYAKIDDTDKNVNEISITAKGLDARLSDAEGGITQLDATAKGLQVSVSNLDGAITNIKTDVNGLRATVSGKIDSTQAQSIFDQSAKGFTLGATSGENGTIFKLNYNGVQVASTGSIDLCVDAVNIYGTLTAEKLRGKSVDLIGYNSGTEKYESVGSLALARTGTGQTGVGLSADYGGMRFEAAGNVYLKSDFGPFALIGKDDVSDYPAVSLGGGYLVLSGSYMFGASPPKAAPYGTVFFLEE